MTARSWSSEIARREMARLTGPGVLGFYTHFEATVVFGFPPGQREPVNVFTILVAEERLPDAAEEPHYLNRTARIVLQSLKGWSFGVQRYLRPIVELVAAFDVLCASKTWQASGHPLRVADLNAIPTQFVPPDSAGSVPWNRVLKNNFWNGSHVFEWADPEKTALKALFDYPPALQDLSEAVRGYVPVGLASLSDRLGNIVVQLPVTVLMSKFGEMRESADFMVDIAWNPKASPRPLRATCELDFDDAITGFSARDVDEAHTLLPMQDGQGLHRAFLWDDKNRVLLAASGNMCFIRTVAAPCRSTDRHGPRYRPPPRCAANERGAIHGSSAAWRSAWPVRSDWLRRSWLRRLPLPARRLRARAASDLPAMSRRGGQNDDAAVP
jgi:hypothetical protein